MPRPYADKSELELTEEEVADVIRWHDAQRNTAGAEALRYAQMMREQHGDQSIDRIMGVEIGTDGKLRLTD